jgi:hypothetical protein
VRKMENQATAKFTKFRLQAILEEYKTLKNELLQKFQHQMQMYSITITAVVAIIGVAFAQKIPDILLITPAITSAFAFRYIWEQSIIVKIGDYLRIIESEIMPKLTGYRDTQSSKGQ